MSTTPTCLTQLKAILFDFDGTLADSYQAITSTVNHVRAAHALPPLSEPEVRQYVGEGPAHLLGETVGVGDTHENVRLYRAHHPSVMKEQTFLLPGAREVLNCLKQRDYRLGICSNKPVIYTRELIRHLKIDRYFDVVLGPGEIKKRKPDPEILLTAMERLNLCREETLYVGDMTIDIETARSAKIKVWVLPTGSHDRETLEQAKPDRVIDHLGEILKLIH